MNRHYIAIAIAFIALLFPWFAVNYPAKVNVIVSAIESAGEQIASVFLSQKAKSVDDLIVRYYSDQTSNEHKRVRVLIVPGHEPDFGGAEVGDMKERDLVLDLSEGLVGYLKSNDRFQVFVTRDRRGWSLFMDSYFKQNKEEVAKWHKELKEETYHLMKMGEHKQVTPSVYHNSAPSDVAMRLYAINKWAFENDIDIILHLHFNDYAERNGRGGEYSGFAIYVPEKQYMNSTTTRFVADKIFGRMSAFNAVSNLPGESNGIIEDQDLIAVGAFNSVKAASMLIEYGYLYEPQFASKEARKIAIQDLAYATYLGLIDFFDNGSWKPEAPSYGTVALPHLWAQKEDEDSEKALKTTDIFALQSALVIEGVYPPDGKTLGDCPRTGRLGDCTKRALSELKDRYSIQRGKDLLDQNTIELLNRKYGPAGI